jgi:hypothetical protein
VAAAAATTLAALEGGGGAGGDFLDDVSSHAFLNGGQMPDWQQDQFKLKTKKFGSAAAGYEVVLAICENGLGVAVMPVLHLLSLLPAMMAGMYMVWLKFGC